MGIHLLRTRRLVQVALRARPRAWATGENFSCYQAVLNQEAKYNSSEETKDTPAAASEREVLQAELRKAEAAAQAIENLPPDDDLVPVLEARKARRDEIRTKLHAARPVKSQVKAAEETRDRLCRSHLTLSEELHGLKIIVQNKQQELDALAKDVSNAILAVSMQQLYAASDDGPQDAPPISPVPAAGTTVRPRSAGPVHVRAKSARSDPYGGNPCNYRAGRQWTASEDGSRADGSVFHSEVCGTAGHGADI